MKKKMLFIVIIILLILIIKILYFENELKKNGVFTIAKVENIGYMKGGMYCEYSYIYNRKKYNQNNYIGRKIKPQKGSNYLLIFLKEKPSESRIIIKIPIKEKFNNPPLWENKPPEVNSEIINEVISGDGFRFF